jgi:hypothetical protein
VNWLQRLRRLIDRGFVTEDGELTEQGEAHAEERLSHYWELDEEDERLMDPGVDVGPPTRN